MGAAEADRGPRAGSDPGLAEARERAEQQCAPALLLVRPAQPSSNAETRASNSFQGAAPPDAARRARAEFEGFLAALAAADIQTWVLDEPALDPLPDSVFPNNWFSTHPSGELVLYPLLSPLRQRERRPAFIERIAALAGSREILDWSAEERAGRCLEGTGSLVLDHPGRRAFAALSPRTDRALVERFGARFGYRPVCFEARHRGAPIYHTNVVLSLGAELALLVREVLRDPGEVLAELEASGRRVLELTAAQMERFAANALEVRTRTGQRRWVLSKSAFEALDAAQRAALSSAGPPVVAELGTIELLGGGSARCMLAELWPRQGS